MLGLVAIASMSETTGRIRDTVTVEVCEYSYPALKRYIFTLISDVGMR
jgi:hypothetical protein